MLQVWKGKLLMAIFILEYTNGDKVISSGEFIKAWNDDYRQKGHSLWSCVEISHPSQASKL